MTFHRFAVAGVMAGAVGCVIVGMAKGFPTEWFFIANVIGTLVAAFILLLVQHTQNRKMNALNGGRKSPRRLIEGSRASRGSYLFTGANPVWSIFR